MNIALGITAIFLLTFWLVPCFHDWVKWKLERPPEWMNTACLAWLVVITPWFFYRPLQILVIILIGLVVYLL